MDSIEKIKVDESVQRVADAISSYVKLDEAKSSTGYELYHKDFSSAMQHAYDFAKKKFGITIDPKEIDDKVATGPKKPSKDKTNKYRLKGDKGKVQIQVTNLDNKRYELNMYKEEVELDEIVIQAKDVRDKLRGVKFDINSDDKTKGFVITVAKKDLQKAQNAMKTHPEYKKGNIKVAVRHSVGLEDSVGLEEWTVSDVEIAMKKRYGKVDKAAIEKLKKVQYRGNVDRNDLVKVGHGKLNVESVELDEAKYEYDGKVVKISKKEFAKVSKDYKNSTKGKERMMILDPKTKGSISVPVQFEELEEARQLKNPKKEVLVVKNNKVIVIDKKDAKEYLNKGWELAEEQENVHYDSLVAEAIVATIKVGEDAVDTNEDIHYAVVKDRKVEAVGEKKEMIEYCKENGGRVWKTTKNIGELVEEVELDENAAVDALEKQAGVSNPTDKKFFQKAAELLKKKDYVALGQLIYDYDTAPREFAMSAIRDKDRASFKKMYGNQKGYFSTMKPKGLKEEVDESVQRAANAISHHEGIYGKGAARAKRDAYRDIGKDKSKDDDDEVKATDADRERADRNILTKLKKSADVKGNYEIKFDKGPSKKVPYKIVKLALIKHAKMKPADKLKFQKQAEKSYVDFLKALKDM